MFDFEKPNIEIAEISEDKKYGRFVVEPLERGYGNHPGQQPEADHAFLSAWRCSQPSKNRWRFA